MSLSGKKLADLPTHLQSNILASLSPRYACSIKPSLESVNSLTQELSRDLLALAKSSVNLRQATINTLAARAQILNTATANPIWEWIAALRDAVKAVSLYDSTHLVSQIPEQRILRNRDDCLGIISLKVFKALSGRDIRLQVLDVRVLPFHLYSRPKELQNAFMSALETSAPSLRELAVRVAPICVKVVSQVSLPKLEVAHLEILDIDGEPVWALDLDERSAEKKDKSAEAFLNMLRALEGHADRSTNKTTLRELRLIRLEKAPCIHNEEACNGLFESVEVLQLQAVNYEWDNDDGVANFVALFPSLRSLRWYGGAIDTNLFMIYEACPKLEELHLHHNPRFAPSHWIIWPGTDFYAFKDACLAYQGKLRSFCVRSLLTAEELKILGETSPELEHFEMQISLENMAGLSCLLGTHCRKLKKLEITLPLPVDDDHVDDDDDDNYETLGRDGWRELANSIRSASDELRDLSICGDCFRPEAHYEAMVDFVLDILEVLGERAEGFHLRVPIHTDNLRIIHDLVCRIINKCVVHSTMLKSLSVKLEPDETRFLNAEDERKWCAKLLNEMKNLEKLPHLHTVDVDGLEDFARETLDSNVN